MKKIYLFVFSLIFGSLGLSAQTAGDVNYDGIVDINDINTVIDIMLGNDVKIPPVTIDFPMPILDFDVMTMDEVIELYKQKPYFEAVEEGDYGPMIKTTSADFPYIIILDEGGKYYAAMLVAPNSLVMRSPGMLQVLNVMEYTLLPNVSVLPTYVSSDGTVMAQLDINDMLGMGLYNISFMPIEFRAPKKIATRLNKR